MQTVVLPGGSGLLGRAISKFLASKGYEVIILSRNPPRSGISSSTKNIRFALWDTEKKAIEAGVIESADIIINLAGATVDEKRWTDRRKKELVESRVKSCETIVKALSEKSNNVKTVINVCGIGWYGEDQQNKKQSRGFVETDPPADNFLAITCQKWEASIAPVKDLGKRLVILRTGAVLSKEGGALKEFLKPVRFGIAAILGNGKQIFSWVHVKDLCDMMLWTIENASMNGVYNAVSPSPVTNRNLMIELARQVKGNFYIPFYVPSFVLKILFGELSTEVLKSTTVNSEKILSTGFIFQYPEIKAALKDLCSVRKD
ncbi:MAG TPA: TIGR01777 family oxidoreductase [Chitinophagaceae bacterium]|nr:TIGR01777 family oxidoreductase [Chitinophagaceae bacterium]